MLKWLKRNISLPLLSLIMSIWGMVAYNIPFFCFALNHIDLSVWGKIMLVVSLIAIMLSVNFLAFYLITYLFRYAGRVIIAITHIINAACVYFVVVYNVIIDDPMLNNVYNTRYSEASAFMSWQLWLIVLLLGILPALYILLQKIDYGKAKHFFKYSGMALAVALAFAGLNYNKFLWIGEYDTELGGLLMPWSYTVNTGRLLSQHKHRNEKEQLLPDAGFKNEQKTAVILVIGESARRANFSLYGYERNTNPLLSQRNDINALYARSCATYTTAGVRSILTDSEHNTLYEILPNYLLRAGADVEWRSNNWGEPPVKTPYLTMKALRDIYPTEENYDSRLMAGLKERIEKSDKSKVLIVLHTTTSHGPIYSKYYPPRFQVFTPICENVEEGRKSLDKLINTYDNSIVYTDYLLNNLIDTLTIITDWQTAVMFVSDHGESLGENGLFMHGVPIKMAPKEQYEIPFIVWNSGFRQVKDGLGEIDQHYVFHSVLNLLDADSEIYDENRNIFTR